MPTPSEPDKVLVIPEWVHKLSTELILGITHPNPISQHEVAERIAEEVLANAKSEQPRQQAIPPSVPPVH